MAEFKLKPQYKGKKTRVAIGGSSMLIDDSIVARPGFAKKVKTYPKLENFVTEVKSKDDKTDSKK